MVIWYDDAAQKVNKTTTREKHICIRAAQIWVYAYKVSKAELVFACVFLYESKWNS